MTNAPVDQSAQAAVKHAATAPGVVLVKEISNRRSWRRSTATLHAQIVATLQRGECSRADLAAELDSTQEVVKRFLDELRDLGVVYVKSRPKLGRTNRTEMFALNPSPFANADAPRINRQSKEGT